MKDADTMTRTKPTGIGETARTLIYALLIAFGIRTFVMEPRWFIPHPTIPGEAQGNLEPMTWPSIQKYLGHDLYVGIASNPEHSVPVVTMQPGQQAKVGPYTITYVNAVVRPQDYFGAQLIITTQDGKQPMFLKPGNSWVEVVRCCDFYGVKVVDVNTVVVPGKNKTRFTKAGYVQGRKPAYKKALITVAEGETIDLYASI